MTVKNLGLYGDVSLCKSSSGVDEELWFYEKRSPSVRQAFHLQLADFINNFIRKELLENLEIPQRMVARAVYQLYHELQFDKFRDN